MEYIDDYIGNTDKVMIITDTNIDKFYGKIVSRSLNLENYKFIVGNFYKPDVVLIDINTLKTLPKNKIEEIIKKLNVSLDISELDTDNLIETIK